MVNRPNLKYIHLSGFLKTRHLAGKSYRVSKLSELCIISTPINKTLSNLTTTHASMNMGNGKWQPSSQPPPLQEVAGTLVYPALLTEKEETSGQSCLAIKRRTTQYNLDGKEDTLCPTCASLWSGCAHSQSTQMVWHSGESCFVSALLICRGSKWLT
jgi:hypothetical protein